MNYLNDLSREELYSVISQLDSVVNHFKLEINGFKTDLINSKTLLDSYEKYFDYFNEINKTVVSNKEVLDLMTKIKSLNSNKQRFVSLSGLGSQTSIEEILYNEPKPSNSRSGDNSDDNNLLDLEVSYNKPINQPLGGPSIAEIFEELNNHKSKKIIRPKKLRGRPKGWKIKPKPRFHCLWSGCEQWFTDIRGLKLHTLRKHKLRPKQKMTIRADPIENSENINTETFENTQQTDPFVDNDMSPERATDYESMDQSIEESIVETFKETNDYKSKKKFKCLWSGCEKEFSGIRAISLHTLRKHKSRRKQEMTIRADPIEELRDSENINTEAIENSQQTDTFMDTDMSPEKSSDFELTNQSIEEPVVEAFKETNQLNQSLIDEQFSDNSKDESNNYSTIQPNNETQEYNDINVRIESIIDFSDETNDHQSDQRFECLWSGCDQWFTNKRGLSLHTLRRHKLKNNQKIILKGRTKVKIRPNLFTGVNPIDGSKASEEANHSTNLNEDINDIQSKESDSEVNNYSDNYTAEEVNNSDDQNTARQYICHQINCGKGFKYESDLRRHKLRHSNEHPFGCVFCGKRSKDIYSAKHHLLGVHPEECPEVPYIECSQNGCNYKTKRIDTLKRHQKTHTLPFACEYCDRRFRDRLRLRDHLAVHTGQPNYVCPVCDKRYLNIESFSKHKRVHSKQLFVCDINGCEKSFILESNLRRHIKLHNN